jgi:putative spermidine/putrescine transport system permease protein
MTVQNRLKVGILTRTISVAGLLFLLAPLLVVVPISFGRSSLLQFPPREFSLRWYRAIASDPQWLTAAGNSLRIALMVAIISTLLSTMAAIGLARFRFPGRTAVQAFVLSPLIVPVIITGVGLYYLFSRLALTGTATALVIGHTIVTFPYGVVVVTAALERFDPRLEQAAMSLGANAFQTFWRVTLPIIRPAIVVAALFAFLISFDEVVIAIFLSGPETSTVPKKMWDGIRFELDPTLAAVSTLLLAFSALTVTTTELLRRRLQRRGALKSEN